VSRRKSDDGAGVGAAVPVDYDTDPGRFAASQQATRQFLRCEDVHMVAWGRKTA
jgi:hypothetical protein